MPTWRLEIEYEGTRYRGWQIQHNAKTVQGELMTAARAWADRLAAGPPIAIRITKRMMIKQQTMSLENALEDAAMAAMITNYTDDVKEGTAAFHEKRKPNFQGR